MQTQNRAAPHFLLGLLTVLSVGAILFSLEKAPPNAQTQLREAAANTVSAASFVLTDVETVSASGAPAGRAPQQVQAVLVYQSPDRVRETVTGGGQNQTALVLGAARYRRLASGKWLSLGSAGSGASSAGALAAADILFPFQAMAGATEVTKGPAGTFGFTPSQERLLLLRLVGSQLAGTSQAATWQATVSGENVSAIRLTLFGAGQEVTVELAVSGVDRAPVLEAPPADEVTTNPAG